MRRRPSLAVALAVTACLACADETGTRGEARFTLLPSTATGITFANVLPENPARNGFTYEYYYNGGGVAVGDLTGNGYPDIYFTSNVSGNRLYLNHGGMRFEDVTERAGVGGREGGWGAGVSFADVNADGRLDMYVSYSGPFSDPAMRRNMLYINQGMRDGVPVFTEEAAAYGLDHAGYSTQAAFFDYDGDGDLDVYVMNHGIPGYRSLAEMKAGRSIYEVDRLFRNDGGRFVDVTDDAGLIDTNLGFGLGLSIGDVNDDGWPDIYVANDFSGRDYLYLGQPDGRFIEVLERAMPHIPLASMGSDIADIDGDGLLDIAVLEMAMASHHDRMTTLFGNEAERFAEMVREGQHYQYAYNALQWNRGTGEDGIPVFSDIAHLAGVARSDWSWAALFADFDNDGRPDLLATNGMAGGAIDADFNEYMRRRVDETVALEGRVTHSLMIELLERTPRRKVANQVFRNDGDLTFTDRTRAWGLDRPSYSYGAAYADLDRNGTLDLVINNLMEEAFVYRNDLSGAAHYLAIRLRGPNANPFGIGARVRLRAGGAQQLQELYLTRGYQSSVEPVLHFGLGASAVVDTLEVMWPDGSIQRLTGVAANRYIDLDYAHAQPIATATPRPVQRLFRDVSDVVRPVARHHAALTLPDPSLQPYPTRRDAVAIAVGDFDGDGRDDFVFGGGGGEPTRAYLQQSDGSFRGDVLAGQVGTQRVIAAAVFDADGDGHDDIWLVTRDAGVTTSHAEHRLYQNDGRGRFRSAPVVLPPLHDAGAVLAPADYDADGAIDLFVGSYTTPGEERGAGSRLLRNVGGEFRDVTGEIAPALSSLRYVTDAVWADIDGDGALDLIVAAEWSPLTVLLNRGGRLVDATAEAGLDPLTGWWQSIAAADLDGDGHIDIVAGNMGLNFPYRPDTAAPFELFIHDFARAGTPQAVPAYRQAGNTYPWFGGTQMAAMIPAIAERYTTHAAFARATLPQILGADALRAARRLHVSELASVVLRNRGDASFDVLPLPLPAQVAPITAIAIADFDDDGSTDIVIAGGILALDHTVPRAAAGVGLFLRGNGHGAFEPVTPAASGMMLGRTVRSLHLLHGSDRIPTLLAGTAGAAARLVRAAPAH